MLSSSNNTTLQLCTTYLINEVNESLSLLSAKVPCGSDPGRRMYEGSDVRNRLDRDTRHTEVIVADDYRRWGQGVGYRGVGLLWVGARPRIFDRFHRSSFGPGKRGDGGQTVLPRFLI